jgi:hypothetical protein
MQAEESAHPVHVVLFGLDAVSGKPITFVTGKHGPVIFVVSVTAALTQSIKAGKLLYKRVGGDTDMDC